MWKYGSLIALICLAQSCSAQWSKVAATVWVHGERNCLSVDYRKVAQAIRLEPGLNTLLVEPGRGIIYGSREVYRKHRPVNVVLKFDPNQVSFRTNADKFAPISQAALFQPDGHMTNSQITVLARAATTVFAFVIDTTRTDNAGGVVVAAYRGKEEYTPVPPEGKPFARVWVDAKDNCIDHSPGAIAQRVTLEPGEYHFDAIDGGIAYGSTALDKERASTQVLIDLDPACVDWCDVGCGGPEGFGAPIAAMFTTRPWHDRNITVRKRTTVSLYVTDLTPQDNAGAVKVVFRHGHTGI